jgi:hypothetical protein
MVHYNFAYCIVRKKRHERAYLCSQIKITPKLYRPMVACEWPPLRDPTRDGFIVLLESDSRWRRGRWRQRWWRSRASAVSVEWRAGRGRRGRVIGGPKIIMWCACGVSCIFVFNLINSLVIYRSTNKMELIPSRYFKFLETRDFHLSCQLISWCMIVQYKWHEPISFGFSFLTFLHSFINCSVVSSPHCCRHWRNSRVVTHSRPIYFEFCYGVFRVPERYLRFPLISAVDFYYVINKLIILISDPH